MFDRDLRHTLADGIGLVEVGLYSEMVEGKTIWEVFPDEVCQVIEPRFRAALAAGDHMEVFARFIRSWMGVPLIALDYPYCIGPARA